MGSSLSVDECTSADNQRVKDCCHLEGETPIEIRIAYQQPKPVPRVPALEPGPSAAAALHASSALSSRPPRRHQDFQQQQQQQQHTHSSDAEKPPMPRGAERLRLPPPAGSARGGPRSPGSQASTGDFDAETFAAPPDSERSEADRTPGRMLQPAALHVLQQQQQAVLDAGCDFFPEIVRISARMGQRGGGTSPGTAQVGGGLPPAPSTPDWATRPAAFRSPEPVAPF
mmetsp:Transcript_8126/g.24709  ORF Transcript_8126/g.24709 Transcript_8126/m.24709 type:complete len:228 (-) Transcript_8126:70-753(-)